MGSSKPLVAFTGEDEDVLARTIYGEARGELFDGMVAVAYVIINRTKIAAQFVAKHDSTHPQYGLGTIASACRAGLGNHHQFSCWNDNDTNLPKLQAVTEDDPVFYSCRNAARVVINGDVPNVIANCTHYYARSMPTPPHWAMGKAPFRIIGRHVFFNNID